MNETTKSNIQQRLRDEYEPKILALIERNLKGDGGKYLLAANAMETELYEKIAAIEVIE